MQNSVAIILAAGQGTRMKSKKSKVLHQLAGKPMVRYVIDAVKSAGVERVILVIGHEAEQVRQHLGDNVEFASQSPQLGTGHAVIQAMPWVGDEVENVLVMCGDTPLIRAETLRALLGQHMESRATITMLTARTDNPQGYGRIMRVDRAIVGIVEQGAASDEQKAIDEVNSGIYCFQTGWLRDRLPRLEKSARGEYYLTDLIAMAAHENRTIACLALDDLAEAMGVNDRVQLAEAEAILRWRVRRTLMLSGVTLMEPSTIFVDDGVEIGRDTVVYPGTFIKGDTTIGEDCAIGPNTYIVDSTIGSACTVFASVVENSTVDDRVSVGPFSRLRAGTHLAADVYIGNFAEAKNSSIGQATKMHHFSYLGDATVGSRVNIAAGSITCNFDSETGKKSRTVLEDDVALGSDTLLVAPVALAHGAATGAGSVVTRDIPADSLAVGVPARVVRKLRKSK
ncbi:MAG: bifunctional UDP-N-acetylglucosamine diphosphorylase/glucosamine-1-phosphate N-acetyltransferase GlmU [Chloroflexi bacterium]|nr:bifunctional UDP-N-acetylglucosamine diphosphorylase/glucosamine-1-phosphate N-acetyltransferase GlmU [Chloroflexota bacterium]